jgi:hypothetical protein
MGVPLGGGGFSSLFCLAADPILTKSPNASVNDGDAIDAPPGLVRAGEGDEKEGIGVKFPLTGVVPPAVAADVLDGDGMLLLLGMYTGGGGCGAPFVLDGGSGGVASAKGLPADAVVIIDGGWMGEGAGAVA